MTHFGVTFGSGFGPVLERFNADLTGKTDKKGVRKWVILEVISWGTTLPGGLKMSQNGSFLDKKGVIFGPPFLGVPKQLGVDVGHI